MGGWISREEVAASEPETPAAVKDVSPKAGSLSMRLETADTLVYDDPLARSTCHLNVVPSDVHLPDWRHLLLQPTKALALLRRLEERAWEAVEAGVYSHAGWRAEVLRPGAVAAAAELRPHCIAALNAVCPSQSHLHLPCRTLAADLHLLCTCT